MSGEIMGNMLNFIKWDSSKQEDQKNRELAEIKMGMDFIQGQDKLRASERSNALNRQVDMAKFTVGKMTDLWETATGVERENLVQNMSSYMNMLPEQMKPILKPYLQTGPLSDLQMKQRDFDKAYPNKPVVTANPEENLTLWAEQNFAVKDYENTRMQYTVGTKLPKSNFISLGEGNYAVRADNGMVNIASEEELQLKNIADKHGVSVAKLIADNGKVYGESTEFMSNETVYETRSVFDVINNKHNVETIIKKEPPRKPRYTETTIDKELKNLGISWQTGTFKLNDKYPSIIYKQIKELRNSGASAQEMEDILKANYSGYQFKITGTKDRSSKSIMRLWGNNHYVDADNTDLFFIKAQPMILTGPEGENLGDIYYDQERDLVYNAEKFDTFGDPKTIWTGGPTDPIGSYDQAVYLALLNRRNKETEE